MSVSITRMLIGIVITNAPLPLNWKDPNSRSFCNGTESRGVVHEAIKGEFFYVPSDLRDLSVSSLFKLFSHWSRSREFENGMVEEDDFSVAKFYFQSRRSSRISQTRASETWARCEGM